jgi:hypothetical protein
MIILGQFTSANAQTPITFTAKDSVLRYDKVFRFGVNLGYYPPWTTEQLGGLAAGGPALGLKGVGANTARPGLEEFLLETYGYDALIPTFESLYQRGIRDMNVIIGGPSDAHRDYAYHCPSKRSDLFANLYEPIWDGGANGTRFICGKRSISIKNTQEFGKLSTNPILISRVFNGKAIIYQILVGGLKIRTLATINCTHRFSNTYGCYVSVGRSSKRLTRRRL